MFNCYNSHFFQNFNYNLKPKILKMYFHSFLGNDLILQSHSEFPLTSRCINIYWYLTVIL